MKTNINEGEYYHAKKVTIYVSPSMLRWLLVQLRNCPIDDDDNPTFKDTGKVLQSFEAESINWDEVASYIVDEIGRKKVESMFDPDNGELIYLDEDEDDEAN